MLMLARMAGFWGGRSKFCTEADALFARMSTAPSLPRKYTINRLIVDLKTAGIWTRLDALYLLAAADAQAALLNWRASNSLANGSGLPFTANVGYVGDGTNPLSGSPTFSLTAQSDQAIGTYCSAYSAQAQAADRVIQITNGDNGINNLDGTAQIATFCSSGTADKTVGTATGHVAYSRSGAAGYEVYSQGVQIATPVRAAASFGAASVALLSGCDSGVTIQAAHVGQSLTSGQMLILKNALAAYIAGL
jgi:hypothetical protein